MGALKTIVAEGLSKSYGSNLAVDGVDLEVGTEIYGLLGPNGSGKTTTVSMLTSLLTPSAGSAQICGFDIVRDRGSIREIMSYVPQYMAVDIKLTGRENVNLYARLYGIKDRTERKRRVEEVLETMKPLDRADDVTRSYSGGMQRRLELAQALVHRPQVLFLDEPTVGLDVSARRSIWEHIGDLRDSGITVFVTTHHMDEAERYCDRVGILKKGVLVEEGLPSELVSGMRSIISVSAEGGIPRSLPAEVEVVGVQDGQAIFATSQGSDALPEIVRAYDQEGIRIHSTMIRDPTLEDVYLRSVGPGTEDEGRFNKRLFSRMISRR